MRQMETKKAFGIIEVLIASTIIVIMLIALISTGRNTLAGFSYSNERAQATYLAQEGIETVRQMRDTAWTDKDATTSWNTVSGAGSYILSPVSLPNPPYPAGSVKYQLTSKTGSLKETQTLNNTQFDRTVTISPAANLIQPLDSAIVAANARIVKVTVSWNGRSVEVSELMTNWYQN